MWDTGSVENAYMEAYTDKARVCLKIAHSQSVSCLCNLLRDFVHNFRIQSLFNKIKIAG